MKKHMENTVSTTDFGFNIQWEAARRAKTERIAALRKEYVALYTQRETMHTQQRDNIFCRYVSLLGKDKYENFKLSVEARAMKMRVELAQAALNRNQMPKLDEIERLTRSRLKSYFEELDEQALAIKAAEDAEQYSRFAMQELRDLYRVLVRRLHPDLHPDQDECLKDLFVKGQAAYRSYDLELLREIIKRLDMENAAAPIVGEDLDDAIARLERDADAIRKDIEALRGSFPFDIEKDLLDPVWVEKQRKALREERQYLRDQIAMYADRLDLLTN